MKNSIHEIKEIQWDWDEDDNGDVAEFVVIDGEKYVDVSYFNQKMYEEEHRFQVHKETDAKTIQDQSDLIEKLNSKIKTLSEEIDLYNLLTPDKVDWMAQYLGLIRDTNAERSLLEKEKADLETKLAESEEKKESYRLQNDEHHLKLLQFYSRLGVEAFGADIHEKALETLMIMKEELEEQLKNAPKYTVYSKVFFIDDCEKIIREDFVEQITINHRDGIYYELVNNLLFQECELFATKEEAQAKLQELTAKM